MGVAASSARRKITRPFKMYNVEERAMKVISKDKPTPAPPHPAMKEVMEEIMRDPSKMKSQRTDPTLLKNLTNVYITSQGHNSEINRETRINYPMDRSPPDDPLFGYGEPKVVPKGKASLRQLLQIITRHSEDPEKYTADEIAKEYNLDIVEVMNLLEYYKALLVFSNPRPKPKIERNPLKRLRDGLDQMKR